MLVISSSISLVGRYRCGLDRWRLRCVLLLFFCFFFFSTRFQLKQLLFIHYAVNSRRNFLLFSTSVGPVHCSQDPQTSLFNNFFIKNGSHGTIYIFKNYFAIVFSVFSFQFQQNKFYLNRTIVVAGSKLSFQLKRKFTSFSQKEIKNLGYLSLLLGQEYTVGSIF